jgi:hypothetical protein
VARKKFRKKTNPNVAGIFARGTERGAREAAEHILSKSNQRVPIEDLRLMQSGKVSQEGGIAVVSYDTPYALKQHEDQRLTHDPGRTSKYLENAFNAEKREALEIIARELREEM